MSNPNLATSFREIMGRGEWSTLPHNWQRKLTRSECRSVFRAKAKFSLKAAMGGESLPRGWSSGLTHAEQMRVYETRGYGSDKMERQRRKEEKANRKRMYVSSHGGEKTLEVMRIASEHRKSRAEYIANRKIKHMMCRIYARHYSESSPMPVSTGNGFNTVLGTFRGHAPFYGRNYCYFDCKITFCNSLGVVLFDHGVPTEFLFAPKEFKVGERMFILKDYGLHNFFQNFSRFEFNLHMKALEEEKRDFLDHEECMHKNKGLPYDWKTIREQIVAVAKSDYKLIKSYDWMRNHDPQDFILKAINRVGLFKAKDHELTAIPSLYRHPIFNWMRECYIGEDLAHCLILAVDIKKDRLRSKLSKEIDQRGSSRNSLRQLRALGFVA